jgi:hypothetical protein
MALIIPIPCCPVSREDLRPHSFSRLASTGYLPGRKKGRGVKLTTKLLSVLELRVRGAIYRSPTSFHGLQSKNFAFK